MIIEKQHSIDDKMVNYLLASFRNKNLDVLSAAQLKNIAAFVQEIQNVLKTINENEEEGQVWFDTKDISELLEQATIALMCVNSN